jgi:hypothetical protein
MDKNASLFTRLNKFESKIYFANDFSLDVVGQGDVSCQHEKIVDIYHVPNLNANLLFVSQLTQTGEIVEFWLDRFYVSDLNKGKLIVVGGLLDPMDSFYKFRDSNRSELEPTALVSHTNERSKIWHE